MKLEKFAPTPFLLKGKVVEFSRINPHSLVMLEEVTQYGQIRSWAVEGPTVSQLNQKRIGPNFLVAGDQSEEWVSFLSSQDPVYAEWCWKSAEIPTREESKALVDEIDSLVGNPCE